jgi:hypothetical protein
MRTNKQLKFIIAGYFLWIFLATGIANAQSMPDQLRKYADDAHEYLEVTEEMFRLIAKEERVEPQIREIMGKLKTIISLAPSTTTFFDQFIKTDELKGFSVLMRAKSGSERYTFYKKESKGYKEYLLIHQEGLIYVQGDIDIKTLEEMGELLELAGEIGSM